jgi:predicted transcriptional regulator
MKCLTCNGTGTIINPTIEGAAFRKARQAKCVSLRAIARSIGKSAAYVSDLELGRRCWGSSIRAILWDALAKASAHGDKPAI